MVSPRSMTGFADFYHLFVVGAGWGKFSGVGSSPMRFWSKVGEKANKQQQQTHLLKKEK